MNKAVNRMPPADQPQVRATRSSSLLPRPTALAIGVIFCDLLYANHTGTIAWRVSLVLLATWIGLGTVNFVASLVDRFALQLPGIACGFWARRAAEAGALAITLGNLLWRLMPGTDASGLAGKLLLTGAALWLTWAAARPARSARAALTWDELDDIEAT